MQSGNLFSDGKGKKIVKLLAFLVIAAVTCRVFFAEGIDRFQLEKSYTYQNEVSADTAQDVDLSETVGQQFTSKGNFLSNLSLYTGEISDKTLSLSVVITDSRGQTVGSREIPASKLSAEAWNTISMDLSGLKRGETYTCKISTIDSKEGITAAIDSDQSDLPYLTSCTVNGQAAEGRLAIGISQVYSYFDAAHALFFGINLLSLLCLLGIAAAAIAGFEKGFAALRKQGFYKYALYSGVIALHFLFLFNPMDSIYTDIQEFHREMGIGILNGYDVSRVILNFMGWIIAAAVLYLLIASFMAGIREKNSSKEQNHAWAFLDSFMIVAGAGMIFRCITFFQDGGGDTFYYSSWLILLIILAVFAYLFLGIDQNIPFLQYQILFLLMFSTAYPIAILSDAQWQDGMLLLGVQYLLVMISVLSLKFIRPLSRFFLMHSLPFVWTGTVTASLFPMALSIYIETVNVLAGRGTVIVRLRFGFGLVVLAMFVLAIALSVILKKWEARLPPVKSLAYPFLIVGITMLSCQVPLTNTYTADIFEGANAGVLISDFLNFGELPIIEHYGGHMMTSVWEGILYGLINNDYTGAVFSPYSGLVIPVIVVAFYCFLKAFLNEDTAFWTVLILPFTGSIYNWGLGLLIPAAALRYMKKNTWLRAILLWLACVWVTLYRLDLGFAFDLACVAGLSCYLIYGKNGKAARQLGITLLGYGIFFVGLWCILCVEKGINPVSRLMEFLKISASNQNWSYSDIGDAGMTIYAWGYVIVPLFLAVSLVCVIFSGKFREKAGMTRWILMIILGMSYFANFPRELVRHSLAESIVGFDMWTAWLYLALLFSCYLKREYFSLIFTGFLLFGTLLQTDTLFTENGMIDTAAAATTDFRDSWTLTRLEQEDYVAGYMEKPETSWSKLKKSGTAVERVVIDESLLERIEPLQEVCELLLDEDETYVDYMNRTLTYCLLQKEDPVYVSQSPIQLSGDYSQECFISEISEDPEKIPLVIMPYFNNNDRASLGLDAVHNNYRYYLVAEYLYQNYVPLCHNDEYAVWCLPSRYEEMKNKISDMANSGDAQSTIELIDYGYDRTEYETDAVIYIDDSVSQHLYDIKMLPGIWAEMDEEQSADNPEAASVVRDGQFLKIEDVDSIDKTQGNYLYFQLDYSGTDEDGLTDTDDETTAATVRMGTIRDGKFVELYRFPFLAQEGSHSYLIRISCDYYWYLNEADTISIECGSQENVSNVKILQGD